MESLEKELFSWSWIPVDPKLKIYSPASIFFLAPPPRGKVTFLSGEIRNVSLQPHELSWFLVFLTCPSLHVVSPMGRALPTGKNMKMPCGWMCKFDSEGKNRKPIWPLVCMSHSEIYPYSNNTAIFDLCMKILISSPCIMLTMCQTPFPMFYIYWFI